MDLITHIARRALTADASKTLMKRALSSEEPPTDFDLEVLKKGGFVIFSTIVVFSVFLASIEYTLKNVVAPLAMIETPSAAPGKIVLPTTFDGDVKLPGAASDKDSATLLDVEAAPRTSTPGKAITSSIRGTVRHLRATAGGFARWRGMGYAFLHSGAYVLVYSILTSILPRFPLSEFLTIGLSAATVAPLHAAWTHKVITMPGGKGLRARMPTGLPEWRALVVPAVVASLSELVALSAGSLSALVLGLYAPPPGIIMDGEMPVPPSPKTVARIIGSFLTVLFIFFASWMLIVLPAKTTQIRIEASLLAEDDETIVPFDRTFGGKVYDRVAGFLEAWKSCDRATRVRVVKLYLKISAIMIALSFLMINILALEVYALMGVEIIKFVNNAQKNGAW